MSEPFHICVFCGSWRGGRPIYEDAARRVGVSLVKQGLGLVYGGGRVGIMGTLADAVLGAGGHVVGVIPNRLVRKELAHQGVTELVVVNNMHERKALMAARSNAFLMLPGGIGTFEEFFEVLSWAALGIHNKPIGILNVGGYFDPLLDLLHHSEAEGFVRPENLQLLLISNDPERIVIDLPRFVPPPPGPLWIDLEET